ncbi:MAG: hypothetical protein ACK55D_10470 [Synechococcaceae cyanobacterium]|jgi:hypothetical protein
MNNHRARHLAKQIFSCIPSAICVIAIPVSAAVVSGDLVIENQAIKIGDSRVNTIVYRNVKVPSGPTFVSLHNNEQTLNPIVISNVIDRGGSFVALTPPLDAKGNLCRYVRFSIGDSSYYFDPNRIWDDTRIRVGTSANCITNELGDAPSDPGRLAKVEAAVSGFRSDLIQILGISEKRPRQYLVSVHNNRFLAFDSEKLIPNKCARRHASERQATSRASVADFFLVTDSKTFDFYAGQDFNVVQQLPSTTSTEECLDGSLSVFAQSRRIPFTTVEVNYLNDGSLDRNALKAQTKSASMLKAVYEAYKTLF